MGKNPLVCAIYSQPKSSQYYSDEVWEEIEFDILTLTSIEHSSPSLFCIIGDMNGRVGEESEFNSGEIQVSNLIPGRTIIESPRRNCDKVKCKVGEKIIQLCKSYDLQVGNGRLPGDCLGNFTHHNKNTGQSTVDLALISDALYPNVDDFKVLPQTEYSDHCKVVLSLKNLKPAKTKNENYKWINRNPGFKWDVEKSPEKFKKSISSNQIKCMIQDCEQRIEAGLIESSGQLIQKIFEEAANLSLEKKKSFEQSQRKKGKKTKKKWFDQDCIKLKQQANKAAILKHRNPKDSSLHQSHRNILKQFKNICRTKKTMFWHNEMRIFENLKMGENFWAKWKQVGEDYAEPSSMPADTDGLIWENHFKILFTKIDGDIDKIVDKEELPISQILNEKFKLEELKLVIKNLKKKAIGPDIIANEFLKAATDDLIKLILDFLNLNLEKGSTCAEWCVGLISLIHKEGQRDDPNNYRGICIMNALLKVLCTLMNNRLTTFCLNNNLINREQIGFQKNSRTSDHILTLKTIVNKYVVDQKGKKLYTCFVDFQKAFDSVWHDGLFRKLENKGINGNFLELIKSIYKKTRCAVKINNRTTNFFGYGKGVQQGNPLSPLLFNLYINDLFETLKNDSSVSLDNQHNINALMYADDLIILSTTEHGLQKSLDALNEYCKKWKLSINVKKTKCMVFSKGTNTRNAEFSVGEKQITNTKEYKYLGITVNSKNCSFIPTMTDLGCKANKAIYSLLSKIPLKQAPIKTMLNLFDTCIAPILLYGSEVWAPYLNYNDTKWDNTIVERVHTQFLKRLLGVNRSTTNVLVRSELGRNSLQEQIILRNINYLNYLECKDESSLASQAAKYEVLQGRTSVYSLLTQYELKFETFNFNTLSNAKLRKLVKENFNTLWKNQVSLFPKAETYRKFKENVKYENYLSDINIRKYRVSFTKFRLSDHGLMIEKGRHQRPKIPREQRICPLCKSGIEDELHLLLKCTYCKDRNNLLSEVEKLVPNFKNLNDQDQFIFLMTQEDKQLNRKLIFQIHKWLLERVDQYCIIKTSLDDLTLSVRRLIRENKIYKPGPTHPLSISKSNGRLRYNIARLESYEINQVYKEGLKIKLCKKRSRYHPYQSNRAMSGHSVTNNSL